jgi:hypothetical protein
VDLERSGDPDSHPFSQIRNPDAQRIRNNPHRPQRDVPSILELGAVPGFSPQLSGAYPSPAQSPPGSFEFVLGFERLPCLTHVAYALMRAASRLVSTLACR